MGTRGADGWVPVVEAGKGDIVFVGDDSAGIARLDEVELVASGGHTSLRLGVVMPSAGVVVAGTVVVVAILVASGISTQY